MPARALARGDQEKLLALLAAQHSASPTGGGAAPRLHAVTRNIRAALLDRPTFRRGNNDDVPMLMIHCKIQPGGTPMWKAIGTAGLVLHLALSSALAQGTPTSPKPRMTPGAIAKQAMPMTLGYRACSFCYSCGGPWPYFAGSFYTSAPGYTIERAASCSGALTNRSDSTPYLCCGVDQ